MAVTDVIHLTDALAKNKEHQRICGAYMANEQQRLVDYTMPLLRPIYKAINASITRTGREVKLEGALALLLVLHDNAKARADGGAAEAANEMLWCAWLTNAILKTQRQAVKR